MSRLCLISNITSHWNRFSALREAISSEYPGKKVPNRTKIQLLVTKFLDIRNVRHRKRVRKWKGLLVGHRNHLTSPELFLWGGFPKAGAYSNNPRSLDELRHNNEHTVVNIDLETPRRVARKAVKCVDACLLESGRNFQYLLQSCSVSYPQQVKSENNMFALLYWCQQSSQIML
jgi:hypothetical protein